MSCDWCSSQSRLLEKSIADSPENHAQGRADRAIDGLPLTLDPSLSPGLVHGLLEVSPGSKTWAGEWFGRWRNQRPKKFLNLPSRPQISVERLPAGSWALEFDFSLRRPLLTKHDDIFYPTENPVRRDRAFGCPIFPGTSWKGALRAAFRLANSSDESTSAMETALFGSYKSEDGATNGEELCRGRLQFYSTFFDEVGFEALNPHSRSKRTGMPIFYESVPIGARGRFTLLWVGHDLSGAGTEQLWKSGVADFEKVVAPLAWMLSVSGFGAKTSSGFGIANDVVTDGWFKINAPAPFDARAVNNPEPLPGYLEAPGLLKDKYLNDDGTFRTRSETELSAMKKPEMQQYHKALTFSTRPRVETPNAPVPPRERISHKLGKLSAMGEVADRVKEQLC